MVVVLTTTRPTPLYQFFHQLFGQHTLWWSLNMKTFVIFSLETKRIIQSFLYYDWWKLRGEKACLQPHHSLLGIPHSSFSLRQRSRKSWKTPVCFYHRIWMPMTSAPEDGPLWLGLCCPSFHWAVPEMVDGGLMVPHREGDISGALPLRVKHRAWDYTWRHRRTRKYAWQPTRPTTVPGPPPDCRGWPRGWAALPASCTWLGPLLLPWLPREHSKAASRCNWETLKIKD